MLNQQSILLYQRDPLCGSIYRAIPSEATELSRSTFLCTCCMHFTSNPLGASTWFKKFSLCKFCQSQIDLLACLFMFDDDDVDDDDSFQGSLWRTRVHVLNDSSCGMEKRLRDCPATQSNLQTPSFLENKVQCYSKMFYFIPQSIKQESPRAA